MEIEIYGIEESDFRCGGCIEAKRLFDEAGLKYTFKRILTRGPDGNPSYSKELLEELKTKIKYKYLTLPYIFMDNTRIPIKDLRSKLESLGYDLD